MTFVMWKCLTLASGSDRIPVELFQILKDDAVESAALNMQYAGSRHSSTGHPLREAIPDHTEVAPISFFRLTLPDYFLIALNITKYCSILMSSSPTRRLTLGTGVLLC